MSSHPSASGVTVWLTGLPSAGKSTIAGALAGLLRRDGREVEVLDGDEVRAHLSPDLGFAKEDRNENVRRIGWLAERLAAHGVAVLIPVIAPYADGRDLVRRRHTDRGLRYFEVHVDTPVEVCAARDPKGLYARQARGELRGLTGVDDPYEIPTNPDLRMDTSRRCAQDCARDIQAALFGGTPR
jgi:adenylylsulfate kinase